MSFKVKVDQAGVAEILKVRMRPHVDEVAGQIADLIDTGTIDAPIYVRSYTSDRAVATVSIAHPAGLGIQAKHGALTRAVAAVGLTLRSKKVKR